MTNIMSIEFILACETSDGPYYALSYRDDEITTFEITSNPAKAMVFRAVPAECFEPYFAIEPSLPNGVWHDDWHPVAIPDWTLADASIPSHGRKMSWSRVKQWLLRSLGLLSCLMLIACAQTLPSPPVALPEPPPAAPVAYTPSVPDERELSRLMASEPVEEAVSEKDAAKAMMKAKTRALVGPRDGDFRGAVLQYRYCAGCLYLVKAKFREPTTLIFPPGEIVYPSETDDWWSVKKYEVGDGLHLQTHVVVIPLNDKPHRSQMTIMTDKAPYFLEVQSDANGSPSMTAVTWKHPEPVKRKPTTWTEGVYQVGYTIEPQDGGPVWKPTGVWANRQTGQMLIAWPPEKLTHAAPMIYVFGPDGKTTHTVNWRDKGEFYEVDRIASKLELRLGHDEHAEVVTITAGPEARLIRCPGDAACPPRVEEYAAR